MRPVVTLTRLACWILLISSVPASAFAQASIAGVVKDSSGAVLPGVTVEAASPALIEKVRSVVSDGTGQYQIVNLVPGTYVVTFTLPGFNTVKREGIVLAGSFTAKIDADLRVGALEETITVSGETPLVDVQNTKRERVIDREIIDNIPTSRTAYDMASLIPGVSRSGLTNQDVGGSSSSGTPIGSVAIHGGRTGDQLLLRNGVETVGQSSTGFSTPVNINPIGTQEVAVDTASAGAEYTTGGVRINVIPRDGGNTFTGALYVSYANPSWQANNITKALKDRGIDSGDRLKDNFDFNPGFGGPIKKDKVWFFLSARYKNSANYATGMYYDKNFNNPNVWVFEPDLNRPAANPSIWKGGQLRLTWQASAKNKIGVNWNDDSVTYAPTSVSLTLAPEAAESRLYPLQRQVQVDWSSPVTNRILLEAGVNRYRAASNLLPLRGLSSAMVPVTEQSTGLKFRSLETHRLQPAKTLHMRFAASYITGAHAVKVGMNHTSGWNGFTYQNLSPLSYRLNNGIPNQLSQRAFPIYTDTNMEHNMGVFAQDKWSIRKLTASYGLRYSYASIGWPEQHLGPSPLTPTRDLTFPAQHAFVSWHDVTPHLGAAYDLFGDGKTAVKVSLNRYLESLSAGAPIAQDPNPLSNLITQTTRSWNDANRDYVPDCNLMSPLANGECGAMANASFGLPVAGATYDPALIHGWGKRGYNWEFSTGVQHEALPRTSIDVSYFRRTYGNARITDNRVLSPADFDTFDVVAPSDPRLPNGGGDMVHGMYNLNPAKFGLASDNFVTLAKNFGDQTEHWHGVDVNLNTRFFPGVLLQGGTSTGRTVTDNCALLAKVPEPAEARANSGLITTAAIRPLQFCHNATRWLTQMKFLGSYMIPRLDVLVSGTLQNLPGPPILANYNLPTAIAAQTLGRPLSGGAANVSVGLLDPNTVFGDRLNQVDFRVGKVLRYGRTRATASVDFYNALNVSTILAQNNTFGSAWLQPTSIMPARFAKVSLQFDF
ncbi:MAG TPA: carboxypeptidase regulatory-like domain-containing protein [Vicinamibacterales bacterium]